MCNKNYTFKKVDPLDLLLDPSQQAKKLIAVAQKRNDYKSIFRRLNQTAAYRSILSSLWYATLPCFDVRGVTADADGDRAVLKYCEWKGSPISCSAIFTTFPTDRGMCCSFNILAAEQIFRSDTYSRTVSELQDQDRNLSFTDANPPRRYAAANEPTTLPGRNKGLYLILDAHNDLYSGSSLTTDFQGFVALVSPKESFPFMNLEGVNVRPGHDNVIALAGTRVDADESLKSLSPEERNCRFPEESENLLIYDNYTFSNCIFECALLFAARQTQEKLNLTHPCVPWYFPTTDDLMSVCDPWEAVDFNNFMVNDIPDDQCAHCLPDCSATIYDPVVTTVPFRRCDASNLGVSRLCAVDNYKLPQPTLFATQLLKEYASKSAPVPPFVARMASGTRTYGGALKHGEVFTQLEKTYEAYEKDMAVVQVFFRKSAVFRMGSQPTMTWINFFSNVGGLLGLVLGMGIISVVELVWLCLRLVSRKANTTHIIS